MCLLLQPVTSLPDFLASLTEQDCGGRGSRQDRGTGHCPAGAPGDMFVDLWPVAEAQTAQLQGILVLATASHSLQAEGLGHAGCLAAAWTHRQTL